MEPIELTILVDNNCSDGLVAEHGYSLWFQRGERIILFDTGDHRALVKNARSLGKDLAKVTDLVLSHGHYDHSGGVDAVVNAAAGLHVYLHPAAVAKPRYSHKDGGVGSAEIPSHSLRSLEMVPENRRYQISEPFEMEEGLGLTGYIARRNSYEDTGGVFSFDRQGLQVDPIEDDIALWARSPRGLVICVGCSHAGIVNTLETVMDLSGETTIQTIIGGLHLKNATDGRLQQTVSALNRMDINRLICCHCTGDGAVEYLQKELRCPVEKGFAGLSLTI
ncbi:MAG: MBL fold metallo-hydrolase [Desulfocapsaceae bacterium]|jgi:7,8-dihydropterin-6-yl-methyl-4-(beta-D-ribofuranosyl)aminobenzene 5'-phosphate synthase|nr:MBL fold metallo-hydrolase [Desulfocapsaceae bacterium]